MNTTSRALAAFAISAATQGSLVGLAFAQASPPAPGATATAPSYDGSGPEQAEGQAGPEAAPSTNLPVLLVTEVEVLRTAAEPKLDIVRVTGLASSQGWSAPQLVPTYAGKPFDDVLDLELIATPPEQSRNAGGFAPVDAIFPLEPGYPFKGVRVRASENALAVKQIPGSAQATVNINDCKDCVGQKLILEGHAQPGQPGAIRQDDLPKILRLITPSDGVRGAEQNPNRLTLILDEENTIVEAFWE